MNSNPSFRSICGTCCSSLPTSSSASSISSITPDLKSFLSPLRQKFKALPALPLDAELYPPISTPFPNNHPNHCRWPSSCIESPIYFVDHPEKWFDKSAADHLVYETFEILAAFFGFRSESELLNENFLDHESDEDYSDSLILVKEEKSPENEPGKCTNERIYTNSRVNFVIRVLDIDELKEKNGRNQKNFKIKEKRAEGNDPLNDDMEQRGSGPVLGTYFSVMFRTPGFVSTLTTLFEQKQVFAKYEFLPCSILRNVIKDGSDKDFVEWISKTKIFKMFVDYAFNKSRFSEYDESISLMKELWSMLLERSTKAHREISDSMEEEEIFDEFIEKRVENCRKRKKEKDNLENSKFFCENKTRKNEEFNPKDKAKIVLEDGAKRKKVKDLRQEKERHREERKRLKAEKEMTRKRKKERKAIRVKKMLLEVCEKSMSFIEEEGLFDFLIMTEHILKDIN
eukprot:MONOS_2432.1-p1 / transcript=MONOS_2432.1 / gene=MONOS_2432 / organism=Monocercomonoides_exilis_PA203 / gene_product=unspecified product / transcript_product=unspecified product / location=Mono_scaffold00050:62584-64100(-) / protein_length=456 / sequence_SO=supercontig / SO=protein_coding / is_pseudo=false